MIRSSAVAAAFLLGPLMPAAAHAQGPSQACAPQVAQAQRAPTAELRRAYASPRPS